MKSVTQEHPAGCAVACVASILGKTYSEALQLFKNQRDAADRGYYCKEICSALKKDKKEYLYKKFTLRTKRFLKQEGTIVFIKKSKKYLMGHFLVKTKKGWMNPWINFPSVKPAKSGFQKKIPGKIHWIIYKKD